MAKSEHVKFSLKEFEECLPRQPETNIQLWDWMGLQNGEHCYRIRIPEAKLVVFIQSTIDSRGFSMGDPIHVLLGDEKTIEPLCEKTSGHIKLTHRWNVQLKNLIAEYIKLGKKLSTCRCGLSRRIIQSSNGGYYMVCPSGCPEAKEWINL